MLTFYENLPAATLQTLLSTEKQAQLPADWFVVITDVVNSTAAILNGKYKDVNMAGGLTAIALSNVLGTLDFPFVFGGDGTTFLIPPDIYDTAVSTLADCSNKIKQFFGLDMRVGIIPVEQLYKLGLSIFVAKLSISKYYNQAIISGSGIDYAEHCIKVENKFLINQSNGKAEADFYGFSCRWQDVPTSSEETISLIVKGNLENEFANRQLTQEVLKHIQDCYGAEQDYHPIALNNLNLSFAKKTLSKEVMARTQSKAGFKYWLLMIQLYFEIAIAYIAIKFKIPIKAYHYRVDQIKSYNRLSSDFKKYDGSLKMVLSGTKEARRKLCQWLDEQYSNGRLYYGIHVSNRALLTCLLQTKSSQEVHFVDSADGGYTMAAKMLKEQLAARF